MTVRRALQLSLNVPAVAVLGKVGVNRLSARLSQTGAALVLPKGEEPGLAMGLGGVGVRLSDLVMLYTGLARLGAALPLVERSGAICGCPRRLLDPVAAWYVGNILIGAPPPDNAPHGRIAFKTGTSYGYRDAWAVGFDGRMTIGVWVGRPDGAPVPGLVGRASAAPILFDAFARSGFAPTPLPRAPKGAFSPPATNCRRRCSALAPARGLGGSRRTAAHHVSAGWRAPGARNDEPTRRDCAQDRGRTRPADGDGERCAADPRRTGAAHCIFQPDGPGFVRLTVMDARGADRQRDRTIAVERQRSVFRYRASDYLAYARP